MIGRRETPGEETPGEETPGEETLGEEAGASKSLPRLSAIQSVRFSFSLLPSTRSTPGMAAIASGSIWA